MIKFITELLLMGLAVLAGAYFVPGVQVDGFITALIAAILISLSNATIGLLLRILTFPINFLTLGLVSFLISVLMILLVDHWMTGFYISGFWPAVVFAIVLALLRAMINVLSSDKKD